LKELREHSERRAMCGKKFTELSTPGKRCCLGIRAKSFRRGKKVHKGKEEKKTGRARGPWKGETLTGIEGQSKHSNLKRSSHKEGKKFTWKEKRTMDFQKRVLGKNYTLG